VPVVVDDRSGGVEGVYQGGYGCWYEWRFGGFFSLALEFPAIRKEECSLFSQTALPQTSTRRTNQTPTQTMGERALVLEKCLPYDAPSKPNDQDLCEYKCKDVDTDMQQGYFK